MINKFSILNGAKYFSSGIFKNYLLFITGKKFIKYFSGTTQIDSWKTNGMSKENIKISLDQTAIMLQLSLITIYYETQILIYTVK